MQYAPLMSMLFLAETGTTTPSMGELLLHHLLAAIVFAFVGLVCLVLSIWIAGKLSPIPLRKELEEDQNTAVAVILGAMILGMSIIIAAAIHG